MKGDHIILVFTDVQMPGELYGFSSARWTTKFWPEIEIVVARGGVMPRLGVCSIAAP